MVDDQLTVGRTDQLLALTNFEVWSRVYMDGHAPTEVEAELVAGLTR